MDPATLATAAIALLSPYLIKVGGAAAQKIGEALPENAGKLWQALTARLRSQPGGGEAARHLSEEPANEAAREALRRALKDALETDPEFMDQLADLFEHARKESINRSALAGNNSNAVNIGGNVDGNIVIGNNNSVNDPTKNK